MLVKIILDTLSAMISAQNFSMPAGYIEDKSSHQWLVEVGDNFTNEKQLKNLVLTKIDGVGKIRVKDIADITVVDNQGDAYSKVKGENAILLSVFKGSTANTSTVSKGIQNSFKDLEKKYKGLSFTTIMNQGDYINIIIKSVLSSILLGAVLAIIVLALFLKDIRPTIVVAFSIPFSVLFAIIIMYFTGININVMSLAGLCLGIGMLVDNSIVVMENIYRFRNEGMSASKAAVRGTAQVAGPILASTITTICVFLPMVYTSGMVSQLIMPFAFTISYAANFEKQIRSEQVGMNKIEIKRIDYDFTVCKVTDYSLVNWNTEYCFIGKTEDENSLVCFTRDVPQNVIKRDDGWKVFRIQEILDFSLIGILSRISGILAKESISVFAVSTFNTDYIFVKNRNYEKAMEILKQNGYSVVE